jgi:hypothetical protein
MSQEERDADFASARAVRLTPGRVFTVPPPPPPRAWHARRSIWMGALVAIAIVRLLALVIGRR